MIRLMSRGLCPGPHLAHTYPELALEDAFSSSISRMLSLNLSTVDLLSQRSDVCNAAPSVGIKA